MKHRIDMMICAVILIVESTITLITFTSWNPSWSLSWMAYCIKRDRAKRAFEYPE